ncbi:MAG: acetyl-CoA carboxylase biotin carboxylase subunit [Planctomycetota bacterium]
MFSKLLVANRGEIALRILRACREVGVSTVAVYSEADRGASYLELADQTVCIGRGPSADSYLNIPRIISAAEVYDVDAIHPGYGFLAENAHFNEVVRSCKIEFVGPSPEAMSAVGDKVNCKKLAREADVPTVPGSVGALENEEEAVELCEKIGFPVIIKAAAGGGGRGMRVARNEASLKTGFSQAKAEAAAAFGNGTVYIEKFVEFGRHVEVQVIADRHGNAIHLWERDCSLQRRHQKLMEESPSPHISQKTREAMCAAAVRLIQQANYDNAGTVEYLVDADENFYLLEVNARIQVEHPVTEQVTGLDLIQLQLRVASGEPLGIDQKDVPQIGHAMEFRINAEDPSADFRPQPGLIETWLPPGGPGVRLDTHAHAGYRIPPNYDSMIGKLIIHRNTREEVIACAKRALGEFRVGPIKTTVPLHQQLLEIPEVRQGGFDTNFVERVALAKS